MKVLMPPDAIQDHGFSKKIFLAGSIEMGKAEMWQDNVIRDIENISKNCGTCGNILVFNPRRPDWDSTWKQNITDGNFYRQVSWELTALEKSTHILYYFAPNTMSPISLLELGKFSTMPDKKVVVVASAEYARKGNIDIFCERYNIRQSDTLQAGTRRLI